MVPPGLAQRLLPPKRTERVWVAGRLASPKMKPAPHPQATAARTASALRELAAFESLALNLAAGLKVDAELLEALWASAERPGAPPCDSESAERSEESGESAAAAAVYATERALALGQTLENCARLARRWAGLLLPASRDPSALAAVGALATLDLVEDFIRQSSRLSALATEASDHCRDSADTLRRACARPGHRPLE